MNDEEIKIGQYARDYFTQYFKSVNISDEELKQFLNKYWCNDNFGICYPLLKEVDLSKSIKEQLNYNNSYGRYWKTPVLAINGKNYIMCSQWFKQFRAKLDKWIESHKYDAIKAMQEEKERNKERCMHYDFKKNQCMCTDSGVFTQRCQNIKSCGYYVETKFPIYIVPKHVNKSQKCPCCDNRTEKEFVICTYKSAIGEIQNKLLTYRCSICERNYIADTLYTNYTKSKNVEALDVVFKRVI